MEPDPLASGPRRVEAYLDQILAPLARRLSPFHREELRRELREHLWARVDAYRELGQAEDEAITEALSQFGGAEDFLRQWRRGWTKTPPRLTLREVWEAARPALRPSLAGITLANLPFALIVGSYQMLNGSRAGAVMQNSGTAIFWTLVGFAFLVMPVFIGARQGRRTPQNAGLGMAAALVAEILTAALLYQSICLVWPAWSLFGTEDALFGLLLATLAAWIPVAGGAAALGGWWARRSQARRLA